MEAMDIKVMHTFECSGPALWVALRDPAFQEALAEAAEIDREVLEDLPIPGGRQQRIRVTARKTLPPVAAKAVGTERLSWVQVTRSRDAALRLDWAITPNVIPDRIRAEGLVRITELDGGRCQRLVSGVVEVNVPVVGRRIERQIQADLERSYERAYELLDRWIREGRSG